MRKILTILAWLSGGLGGLMMVTGAVAVLAGGILFNHHWVNYFFPGCGFVVLGIFLLLCSRFSSGTFNGTAIIIILFMVLTTFAPGCKTKDLQEQILLLSDQQTMLSREKDSLMKMLDMKSGTITLLQTDTVRLAGEVDKLTNRNRSLANANAGNVTRLKNAEAANSDLQTKANAEAEKNEALQKDLDAAKERLAVIERDLASAQEQRARLAEEMRLDEEKRKADSIADANKPVVIPPKTYGWYMNVTEIGAGFGLGETNVDYSRRYVGVTNVFGYSFSKNLLGGVATGLHAYNGGVMIPLYLDFRYSFGGERFNPFIVADGGYLISLESFNASGLFIHPGVGFNRRLGNKSAMHITVGPLIQNAPSGLRSTFVQVKGGFTFRGK